MAEIGWRLATTIPGFIFLGFSIAIFTTLKGELQTHYKEGTMNIKAPVILYLALMVVTIVVVDLLFFRDMFWARLMVNIGIVLVFLAFYMRYLRQIG